MASTSVPPERPASVWVRLIAFAIDIMLVKLFVVAAAVVLSIAVSERVRVADPVFSTTACAPWPAGSVLPSEVVPTGAQHCTRSLFGILRDDQLVARSKPTADGETTLTSIPITRGGRPASIFYLDDLTPFLLLIYLVLLEWRFGATGGKWFVAMLVRSTTGVSMTLLQAFQRGLIRVLALVPAAVSTAFVAAPEQSRRFSVNLGVSRVGTIDSWVVDSWRAISFLFLVYVLVAGLMRWRQLHDRLARTTVVREFAD